MLLSCMDEHVFSIAETDYIPAVLGRGIVWSYVTKEGELLSINAYDTSITAASDLRCVSAEHPLTKETDTPSDNLLESLMPLIGAVSTLFREVAWARVHHRTLIGMLGAKDEGFYRVYDQELRQVAERDLLALELRMRQPMEVFLKCCASWLEQDEESWRARLGENAQESSAAWNKVIETLDEQARGLQVKCEAESDPSAS